MRRDHDDIETDEAALPGDTDRPETDTHTDTDTDTDEADNGEGLAARVLDRRTFLQVMEAGGAAAAGAGDIYSGRETRATERPTVAEPSTQIGVVSRANTSPDPEGRLLPDAIDDRVLVVVELEGGNDGLSEADGNGNLRTEVPFDAYLGTLAQSWLGIEAASVLPGDPEILDLV
ncbi:MAG: hypothetical protein OEV40_24515 [Acidimicrobiia bacterium]|nr:hypothetical protein [Acidimicrobiia bacterium]